MQFSARFIAYIIQFASQRGVEIASLLDLTGKNMEELTETSLFFDTTIYNTIFEKAIKESGDKLFGLHLGEYLSLSAAGLIVQIAQSSRTVLEALQYLAEFSNLGLQALPFHVKELATEWELSLVPNTQWQKTNPLIVQQTTDIMVVFAIREFHTLTRQRHYPNRINFSFASPTNIGEYKRILNCPLHFGQAKTAIYVAKEHVEERVITSDYKLLQILVQHAREKLVALKVEFGFVTVVKQSILHLVRPQFPTIEQVAANLNLSVRTLQRRLTAEGVTYKLLLDELKQQLALDYLKNKELSIREIAYLLDYAEPSSFIRSFKRWTGKTPKAYKAKII